MEMDEKNGPCPECGADQCVGHVRTVHFGTETFEVEPCGLCGGSADLFADDDDSFFVLCTECCTSYSSVPSASAAVKYWNEKQQKNRRILDDFCSTSHFSESRDSRFTVPAYLKNVPFQVFSLGAFLLSISFGMKHGIPYFFSSIGVTLIIASFFISYLKEVLEAEAETKKKRS